ncbi:uncharacterized protein LOC108111614 [Drosophila eugracilis]|uniref:uncharacterized protein LOC108111614 n=1 Tax=Drosophila eugracilis TaxID=29029 RepID=UPI001BD9BD35|nr:uncharacterized protein LOC108111614 [Drosophila eugracilis]
MSSSRVALVILVIACLILIALARPRSRSSKYNEVTYLPAERRMSNEIMDQISPIRRPHKREFNGRRSPSPFNDYFHKMSMPGMTFGGANYFGNDVQPLSKYDVLESASLF